MRADGAIREVHYGSKNLDGSFTTTSREFDGTETRTTMDENGRSSVRVSNPDGTSTETDYGPDGSGHTVTLDAAGNATSETTIEAVPDPVPRDFEPDGFLSEAQNELPPDFGGPVSVPEPESRVLSDAEVDALSDRGIAGPIGTGDPTELDDAAIAEPVGAAMTPEVEMPAGALGDPSVLANSYETQQENIITPDPFPEERIWPGEETIEGMEPEVEIEGELDSVEVDGPEEDIILPEPAEDHVWPEEEQIEGMEPAVEYDPIGPDPAVESDPAVDSAPEPEP